MNLQEVLSDKHYVPKASDVKISTFWRKMGNEAVDHEMNFFKSTFTQ